MRRYKPDMMTILVILVAIGVITTTSIQAQEIENRQPSYKMKVSASCIDIFTGDSSCLSHHDPVPAAMTDAPSYSDGKIWQAHTLGHEEAAHPTPLFALKDNFCDKADEMEELSVNADFSNMKIGLSRNVTIDFEMEAASHLGISGIYLGFKDCWF